MNDHSTTYSAFSALGGSVIQILALETALSYYKFLYELNGLEQETQLLDIQGLDRVLKDFGYEFDPENGIYYSTRDAWQRNYGYCRLYDEMAALVSMIIDCEPIRFEYGGQHWMIELWKGQYGMTCGGEIGVFTSGGLRPELSSLLPGTFFRSRSEEECLPMSFVMKKDGKVLFQRKDVHWWLTGFVLGEFAEPSQLTMDVEITLKDNQMCRVFTEALFELGYPREEVEIAGTTVSFCFDVPKSRQPLSRSTFISSFNQKRNRFLCRQYQKLMAASRSAHGAITKMARKYPYVMTPLLGLGSTGGLMRAYEAAARYLKTPETQ